MYPKLRNLLEGADWLECIGLDHKEAKAWCRVRAIQLRSRIVAGCMLEKFTRRHKHRQIKNIDGLELV